MKVLLTGFEAFGGYKVNPTEMLVNEFHKKIFDEHVIEGRVLKLEYHSIRPQIQQFIDEAQPNIIILTGQAPRPSITLERVAINYVDTGKTPYNCGTRVSHELLDPTGKTAYFSTLPIVPLERTLREHNIPSRITYSAGTFGCNQVFYETMRYLDLRGLTRTIAGFIHIPLLPEQALNGNSAFMNFDMMKQALEIIIKECIIYQTKTK